MPRPAYLLPTLLVTAACFNPDYSKITVLCTAADPACPDGQVCVDNICVATPGTPDGQAADLAMADGSTPADMSIQSGCAKGGGQYVGKGGSLVFACPGTFAMGQARQQCAAGWSVCTKADTVSLTACDSLSGFFVADVPAYWVGNMGNETCGTALVNQQWYGCGSKQTNVRTGKGCQSFQRTLDCVFGSGWTCSNTMHSLNTTANDTATDGLLCCKP